MRRKIDYDFYALIPVAMDQIQDSLREWQGSGVHLIVTTGGTGFAPRDVTPEATAELIDRPAPGLLEAARAASPIDTAKLRPTLRRATGTIRARFRASDTLDRSSAAPGHRRGQRDHAGDGRGLRAHGLFGNQVHEAA